MIDVVLVVPDARDEAAYAGALQEAGYAFTHREPEWFEHRLLKGPDTAVNLHVFPAGCEEFDRMVLFRDRLRTNDADRGLYEAKKRELAAREWRFTQQYADAKTDVVRGILSRAAPA